MEKKTGEPALLCWRIREKPLERILTANPDFKKKFYQTELPVFINDELVTLARHTRKKMAINWMKWEFSHCIAVLM